MDPLHLAIALGPLALYLLVVGLVNLSRWPRVASGARDAAALGAAISGLVVAGPMELFLPEQAVSRFGPYGPYVVWLLMLALYGLCVTLLALVLRPRLVIYNVTVDQLRPVLAETAAALDKDARWAGMSLVLPKLGVSLYVEPSPATRNVQLVSVGARQSYAGWHQLETALAAALRETSTAPNPFGVSLVLFAVATAVLIAYQTLSQPAAVAAALQEMLRL
jgi:hypothetical protein